MPTVAIYSRVSTTDQDASRQLDELRTFAQREYPDAELTEFVDIISGTATDEAEQYQALREEIATGEINSIVVDEISRLSRLGGGEIHEFIQHALQHDTSVRDREVGLSIDVDGTEVDQAVKQMLASLLGDLAKIEHKQKLRRIRSGIKAARDAGKWTGRPPTGFDVENGHLRVDVEEFLRIRGGIERIATGEGRSAVADDLGIAESTLKTAYNERSELYLFGEANDKRLKTAVDELKPLPEPEAIPVTSEERVREIVHDELQ